MQRTEINSSNILSLGYDPSEKILTVEFRPDGNIPGGVYRYWDVPLYVYETLLTTDSPGRYLAKEIKPNFTTTKVVADNKAVMPRFRRASVDVETK